MSAPERKKFFRSIDLEFLDDGISFDLALEKLHSARETLASQGYTEDVKVGLYSYGNYAEDGQYCAISATRLETEEEYAKRMLKFKGRSERAKKVWERRRQLKNV